MAMSRQGGRGGVPQHRAARSTYKYVSMPPQSARPAEHSKMWHASRSRHATKQLATSSCITRKQPPTSRAVEAAAAEGDRVAAAGGIHDHRRRWLALGFGNKRGEQLLVDCGRDGEGGDALDRHLLSHCRCVCVGGGCNCREMSRDIACAQHATGQPLHALVAAAAQPPQIFLHPSPSTHP